MEFLNDEEQIRTDVNMLIASINDAMYFSLMYEGLLLEMYQQRTIKLQDDVLEGYLLTTHPSVLKTIKFWGIKHYGTIRTQISNISLRRRS